MHCRTRPLVALFLLLALVASAEEAPPVPPLLGLTVVVNTVDQGFFVSGEPAKNDLIQLDLFLYIDDLKRHFDEITSVRIETASGVGWTIDKKKYANLDQGYIGGFGHFGIPGDPGSGQTLVPTDLVARVQFADGRTQTKWFAIPPPQNPRPQEAPTRFLVNKDFPGLITPYHRIIPSPAQVTALRQLGDDVEMEFRLLDPLIDDGQIMMYDASGQLSAQSPALKTTEGAAPWSWVNDGQGLFRDGRTNKVRVPHELLKKLSGKPVAAVAVFTSVGVDPETNLLRAPSLYRQRSASYRYPPASGELLLANPPVASAVSTSPSPWSESHDADFQWEIRLEGPLGALNGHSFQVLSPLTNTKLNRERADASLRGSWSIVDRASLIRNLERLRDFGHRKKFQKAQELAKEAGNDDELAARDKEAALTAADIRFARQFSPLVADRGILAWDLCRVVFLARTGYFLGYLDEAEARSWLTWAGDQIRDHYHSWRELGEHYLIGRMFWGGEAQAQALYLEGHRQLERLLSPGGDWSQAPWAPPSAASTEFSPEGLTGSRGAP